MTNLTLKIRKLYLLSLIVFAVLFKANSQSNLEIECNQTPANSYKNSIQIDGTLLEYDICGITPSYYISVIDTNCNAWGTRFTSTNSNMNNNFGNANDDVNCRQRVEYYFVYRQNNYQDLVYMDSLLNYWIPAGHTIAIWTPISHDFAGVNSLYPTLGTTLLTKWGSDIQTSPIIVLTGEQGKPSSFTVDTLTVGDSISVSKSICIDPSLGIEDIQFSKQRSLLKIVDSMGRETKETPKVLLFYIYSDGTTEKVISVE